MPRYVLPMFAVLSALFVVPLFIDRDVRVNAQAPVAKPADAISYAVGLNIGSQLAAAGFTPEDLKSADFLAGITDALKRAPSQLSEDELRAAGEAMDKRMGERVEALAKDNLAKSLAFLEENKKKDGVQTLPSGLQIVELKKGNGAQPKQTSTVTVHYEGTLIDGTVFDSSVKRGEPATFPVNRVIAGWTEALQRMRVGDKWKLFIPPELAYGPQGSQGAIGPNQALIFEVELLDVK